MPYLFLIYGDNLFIFTDHYFYSLLYLYFAPCSANWFVVFFLIVQQMCHLRCDEQVVKKILRSTEVGNFYRAFISIYFLADMYVFANRCYQASYLHHLLPTSKSRNMRPSSVFLCSFGTQYRKLPGQTQMFIAAVYSPFIQISFFL